MMFPSSLRRRTRDLSLVPVVSAPVDVDPSCRYDNLPHFSHFGDSISFVGGINKPKLIQCFDSVGHCHRQLVGYLPPCLTPVTATCHYGEITVAWICSCFL